MESPLGYESLDITTQDVTSHSLNTYEELHDRPSEIVPFIDDELLSAYEPLDTATVAIRSHELNTYTILNEPSEDKGLYPFKYIQSHQNLGKYLLQHIK